MNLLVSVAQFRPSTAKPQRISRVAIQFEISGDWVAFAPAARDPEIDSIPKGLQRQKRPEDVISATVLVSKIATSEEEELPGPKTKDRTKQSLKKKSGLLSK
ncbi:hypothetical protein ACI5KX_14880 [Erythrobacter sp. GH1-10]|uniref:hypothetical protein n=1 Tax=Erythrobacter sp. GH1-10 TaxID=3349334 RepID=UPI0038780CA0